MAEAAFRVCVGVLLETALEITSVTAKIAPKYRFWGPLGKF
jgi:hypothetical protein